MSHQDDSQVCNPIHIYRRVKPIDYKWIYSWGLGTGLDISTQTLFTYPRLLWQGSENIAQSLNIQYFCIIAKLFAGTLDLSTPIYFPQCLTYVPCSLLHPRGVCTQAPCYCIIMEFCAQGQLYEVLRAGRKVTPSLLVDWSMGIAGGMNYLHLHKIIHRDLKSPK